MRLPSVLYELLNGFFIILFVIFERLTNRPYFLILLYIKKALLCMEKGLRNIFIRLHNFLHTFLLTC